jgi:hypothetical protein
MLSGAGPRDVKTARLADSHRSFLSIRGKAAEDPSSPMPIVVSLTSRNLDER